MWGADRRRRALGVAVLVAILGFVLLEVPAMVLYPGGTWWDPTTVGYRFWQNYLCDLEWRVALDGRDNALGSHFAQWALLTLVAGLAPFWACVALLFDVRPRLGRVVRALGFVAIAGTVAVAFMPSERFPFLHGLAVIGSGVPGLAACGLAAWGLAAEGPRPRVEGWLGWAVLAVSLVDLGLYAVHWASGDEATPLLPAIQKVGLLLLLAWMSGVALRVMRTPPAAA
jgi:hypothetical protein